MPHLTNQTNTGPRHVVVIGGGIAALETVLALDDLAARAVRVTLVAPEPAFTLRPLDVALPFARGHADPLGLADVMREHSGEFVRSAVLSVDASAHTVTLATGAQLGYDVLVLALGASAVPAFSHALTVGEDILALTGILADLEQGWSKSVAFVVPGGCTWPLPLYELALMTADDVWSMGMDSVKLHLVTPEARPLNLFGVDASDTVARLLRAAHVDYHGGVTAEISRNGHIRTGRGEELVVDRVVALPLLEGPRLDGVPSDEHGFIPVSDSGEVDGLECVYAVGDVSNRPIKQGGLACQQADHTAAHIAVLAGAAIDVEPLEQVLRGRLLSGSKDRFLERDRPQHQSVASVEPLWFPPSKVSGRYLAPYLASKNVVHLHSIAGSREQGIEVEVPLSWQDKRRREDMLGLTPLSPIGIG